MTAIGSILELMRAELPDYERLQGKGDGGHTTDRGLTRSSSSGMAPARPARRLLTVQPLADPARGRLKRVDARLGRSVLNPDRVNPRIGGIEGALPPGRFGLMSPLSSSTIWRKTTKAKLSQRVRSLHRPGGRFLVADVAASEYLRMRYGP